VCVPSCVESVAGVVEEKIRVPESLITISKSFSVN